MCEVRLQGIRKLYDNAKATRAAVERLDLTFPSGELVVLIGPSGCGKSTTLRIVAGLEEPTSGQVIISNSTSWSMDAACAFEGSVIKSPGDKLSIRAAARRIRTWEPFY